MLTLWYVGPTPIYLAYYLRWVVVIHLWFLVAFKVGKGYYIYCDKLHITCALCWRYLYVLFTCVHAEDKQPYSYGKKLCFWPSYTRLQLSCQGVYVMKHCQTPDIYSVASILFSSIGICSWGRQLCRNQNWFLHGVKMWVECSAASKLLRSLCVCDRYMNLSFLSFPTHTHTHTHAHTHTHTHTHAHTHTHTDTHTHTHTHTTPYSTKVS